MKIQMLYNTENAFVLKSYRELRQTLWLFKLINKPWLVNLLTKALNLALKIGLPVNGVLKATIFKQFCGGETIHETKSVVNSLYKANVRSILDYSVEGEEDDHAFDSALKELIKIIETAHNNPAIPYTCIKLTGFVQSYLLEKVSLKKEFTESENQDWILFLKRMEQLFDTATEMNVPVYIDAEESWLQPAIDLLAEGFMLRYNKEKHIVLTTLQMYRHDRLSYLHKLIALSQNNNIKLGIKLVRGAYLERENARALEMNYPTPMQKTKEDTDRDFNKAIEICLDHIDLIMLCAGTHNEISTLFLLDEMKKRNIANDHPNVYFSQLYGMSDHITMNLAAENYNVTKYVPYGPVRSVVPYLIRRANENTSIAGQMSRELELVTQEKVRRDRNKLLN
ncbi:MAG: proline dehydrogenase family protein [Sphingobacteriaceae bacterium]|nr:proline dehydrogenase family protein [Sphingobacteriaceae bacterium]